jgi:hypothetical protein
MGLLFVVIAMAGCGGSGSSSAPPVTSRSILWVTNWGTNPQDATAYTRDSFTCEFSLKGANTNGTDFTTIYESNNNRPGTQSLRSSGSVKVGTFLLEEYISPNSGGGGGSSWTARAVVGIPSTVPVDSQGHQSPDFQIDIDWAAAVDSITVPSSQTIKAGVSAPLIFTAHPKGAPSHILALYPYSETVRITSGADHLSYSKINSNGIPAYINGLTPGTATLTVTVQGVTSAPITVTVTP